VASKYVKGNGQVIGFGFKKSEQNWGGFLHNDCRDILFTQNKTPGLSVDALDAVEVTSQTMHVGNSVALLDNEKDGIPDVLFGHVGCSNLVYLLNSGTKAQAKFGQANYDFPSKDPVQVASFAAAYPMDLDGDGKKKLLCQQTPTTTRAICKISNMLPPFLPFKMGAGHVKRMPFYKPT